MLDSCDVAIAVYARSVCAVYFVRGALHCMLACAIILFVCAGHCRDFHVHTAAGAHLRAAQGLRAPGNPGWRWCASLAWLLQSSAQGVFVCAWRVVLVLLQPLVLHARMRRCCVHGCCWPLRLLT